MRGPKWIDHMLNICWICGVSIRKGLMILLNTWSPLSFSGASLSRNLVHWRLHDGHLRYTLKIHGPHGVMDLPKKWTIFVGFIFLYRSTIVLWLHVQFPVDHHNRPPSSVQIRARAMHTTVIIQRSWLKLDMMIWKPGAVANPQEDHILIPLPSGDIKKNMPSNLWGLLFGCKGMMQWSWTMTIKIGPQIA